MLSALNVLRIHGEDVATTRSGPGLGVADCLIGWQVIFRDLGLRRMHANSVAVGGLILATGPIVAVLVVGQDHFSAWVYLVAFGIPHWAASPALVSAHVWSPAMGSTAS